MLTTKICESFPCLFRSLRSITEKFHNKQKTFHSFILYLLVTADEVNLCRKGSKSSELFSLVARCMMQSVLLLWWRHQFLCTYANNDVTEIYARVADQFSEFYVKGSAQQIKWRVYTMVVFSALCYTATIREWVQR